MVEMDSRLAVKENKLVLEWMTLPLEVSRR